MARQVRRTFATLSVATDNPATPATPQPAAAQMRPNPYRNLENPSADRGVLPVQYTPTAMSWQSGQYNPRIMSPLQSTSSPCNSDGRCHSPQNMTQQQSTPSPHHHQVSFAQPLPHDHYNQHHGQTTWYQQELGGDMEGYDDRGSELLYRFGGMDEHLAG